MFKKGEKEVNYPVDSPRLCVHEWPPLWARLRPVRLHPFFICSESISTLLKNNIGRWTLSSFAALCEFVLCFWAAFLLVLHPIFGVAEVGTQFKGRHQTSTQMLQRKS
eukprot:5536199-Amphidinium_carterae.4